ncbi:hypothetical protein HDU91_007275 [Kappamyces sp. JEL0680]|nr:hypothetical protein HDU91_007275 [Kappamyces sp. JEL0680]
MGLLQLPLEILCRIYVFADSTETLPLVCKLLYGVGKDTSTQAYLLLHRYGIDAARPEGAANEAWIHMSTDDQFDALIARFLLQNIPNAPVLVEVAVEWASMRGEHAFMKWLVDQAPSDQTCDNHAKGLSQVLKDRALIQSSLTGFERNVQVLIDARANVQSDNNQALCMASKYGHASCVRALLLAGADVHVEEDYPLVMASRHGHFACVELLLAHGANVQARRNCALHWASEGGHLRIVNLLLDHGADVHSNDDHALRWSAVHGHEAIVETLLKRNADVHAGSDYALRNAVRMQHLATIKVLLAFGADKTAMKNEAMRWAIEHDDQEVLVLLQNSADIRQQMQSLTI